MNVITYNNNKYKSLKGETALETLLRNGVEVRRSCKKGICHTCMAKGEKETIPNEAQNGISPACINLNYFLLCLCLPKGDMNIYSLSNSEIQNLGKVESNKEDVVLEYGLSEETYEDKEEEFKFPKPNFEMWNALENGELLTSILTDFYDKVYDDDILQPYFKNVTKDRVIQKQYSFMNQTLTGDNIYLGDKPRNAHHWMVISDEIFDHRERLLEDSMKKFNLPFKFIKIWLDYDESFRKVILKSKPWDKIQDGIRIPVDGFEEVVMEAPGLCDHCHQEVLSGDRIRYNLHEAKIYCSNCI